MAELTYSDLRSNAERIADEHLKERVLRGIEVLNKFDPDWPNYIDPSELLLESPTQCVLGQVFDNHVATPEQWDALKGKVPLPRGDGGVSSEGYFKGLAILNGDVSSKPSDFGFDTEGALAGDYGSLTEAWLVALGEDD